LAEEALMYPKEVTRWFKALEIAKVLFEDEGYHRVYLNQIDQFIRRKTMYSPKIDEALIPSIYRLALAKKIPMTKLVNRILKAYLEETQKDLEKNPLQEIIRREN
jgi:hypothetical protein